MPRLTSENYLKGFLIDEELMGGVTQNSEKNGSFVAFVLRHTSGEYLGYETYEKLPEALAAINQVQRDWIYESTSACGGGACQEGACGTGSCKKVVAKAGPNAADRCGPK